MQLELLPYRTFTLSRSRQFLLQFLAEGVVLINLAWTSVDHASDGPYARLFFHVKLATAKGRTLLLWLHLTFLIPRQMSRTIELYFGCLDFCQFAIAWYSVSACSGPSRHDLMLKVLIQI